MSQTGITIQEIGNSIYQGPNGQLMNGKIVPSVASNNLTVALKTKAGNDPSAVDPVFVVIDGTVRKITAALSVTKNAGTNWCNAGSAELATKEIDYFVYLGYNATDGVVIGFSRIPYAGIYSDFSATSTNEKYCAISTITNAAAGDNYEVIGRFAATLSAGAGYTWSVPTFTNVNLKQKPIYYTRWLDVLSGGFSWKYKIQNNKLTINGYIVLAYESTAYTAAMGSDANFPFTFSNRPSIMNKFVAKSFNNAGDFPATEGSNCDGYAEFKMYTINNNKISAGRIRNDLSNNFVSGKYYGVLVFVDGEI